MLFRFVRQDPFAHCHAEPTDKGADAADGATRPDDIAALKAENDKLRKQIDDVSPRLKAIEEADKKRADEAARKEEDKRKKDLGADKLLDEKNAALTAAQERLSALEAREAARVQEQFDALPEEVQAEILALKEGLPLEKWSAIVSSQNKIASRLTAARDDDAARGGFFNPGGAGRKTGKTEITPMARNILEQLGHDPESASAQIVKRTRDEESGRVSSRFTRHVRDFFKSMELQKPKKLEVKR